MPHFELGPQYPVTFSRKPPQMLVSDFPTWDKWRREHMGEWDYFLFNVALTMREFPANLSPEQLKSATYVLGKRIDVVAVRKDLVWLIEVTDRAMLRSVGQAVAYREMWSVLKPLPQRFETVILCNFTDEDIRFVCSKQNIRLIEISPL